MKKESYQRYDEAIKIIDELIQEVIERKCKICENCQIGFLKKRHNQKYCSKKCFNTFNVRKYRNKNQ